MILSTLFATRVKYTEHLNFPAYFFISIIQNIHKYPKAYRKLTRIDPQLLPINMALSHFSKFSNCVEILLDPLSSIAKLLITARCLDKLRNYFIWKNILIINPCVMRDEMKISSRSGRERVRLPFYGFRGEGIVGISLVHKPSAMLGEL